AFFQSYTEKVWGMPCSAISAEWGAQRIKGLSIVKAITHNLKRLVPKRKKDIAQKDTETSLIEQFLYPKYGPGQMWEETARRVEELGGTVYRRHIVTGFEREGSRVSGVYVRALDTGQTECHRGEFVFSTMPVKDLIRGFSDVPPEVTRVAEGLVY